MDGHSRRHIARLYQGHLQRGYVRGKLAKWQLVRPEPEPEQGAQPSP